VQCCVGRPATEERELEGQEHEQQEPKAVVTIPWHARPLPPPPPRIVTTGVPRTISNATTLPS